MFVRGSISRTGKKHVAPGEKFARRRARKLTSGKKCEKNKTSHLGNCFRWEVGTWYTERFHGGILMSDTRLILGICPKCGKKIAASSGAAPVFPACTAGRGLACGGVASGADCDRIDFSGAEAYNYVAAHLLACVTGNPDAFRHLTKTEFEPPFRHTGRLAGPVFRAMDDAPPRQDRRRGGRRRLWRPLADIFLDQVEDWSVKINGD